MSHIRKLIEGKFPCQQVGAETRRERDTGKAPAVNRLHVWWARRPLTPSRAALLGCILPDNTDTNLFLSNLGIVKKQALIGDQRWTLVGKNLEFIEKDEQGEFIFWCDKVQQAFNKENERRKKVTELFSKLFAHDTSLINEKFLQDWRRDNIKLPEIATKRITVITVTANPEEVNKRIAFASSEHVISLLSSEIRIDPEDLYAYGRAYETPIKADYANITVLDPTAGGGSIPFEALRLGCNVIANDLNPVATVIEKATLEYPLLYGDSLLEKLEIYGSQLEKTVSEKMKPFYYFAMPQGDIKEKLIKQCKGNAAIFEKFNVPEPDQTGMLYYREVTCPACGKRAPLLNAFALSKKKDGWMVLPQIGNTDKVHFIPVQLKNGKGPHGEDPEKGTIKLGNGTCIHCGQTISSDSIKEQAVSGKWEDKLYCIAAVRYQPKLDKQGNVLRYTTGPMKGQIRTEKISFFREAQQEDYIAINKAKKYLQDNWEHWEALNLIPTENIPVGNDMRPLLYGMQRWCDMFNPRQLIGHLTAMEELQKMMPNIMQNEGNEKGTAIITYLQFMIDKCLDYNSRQTRWEYTRSIVKGTFGRHDFSLKWTYGEMIYAGNNTALTWGKTQVMDAYKGICKLLLGAEKKAPTIYCGTASNLAIREKEVDIICIDPPYYNNVQYAELSDYFYVWQKRTFSNLYPAFFNRRLTNKQDEAVANPVRDGGVKEADKVYESRMSEIFAECRRVLKDDGIMSVMFTHKTQEAWQTLTMALIENGWIITSAFPVDSESAASMHQKDMAAAASSIFIACRKRNTDKKEPTIWRAFGGSGVLPKLREAVKTSLKEYETLHLNAVDEMVASYGSALKVLSESWPVMDGDELVSPLKAMREASTVVAQYQMTKLTEGRLGVEDVTPEAGIVLTLFGIYGMSPLSYDDARNISNSLNIELVKKAGGYTAEGRMIGINDDISGRRRQDDDFEGYHAPVVSKGNKLRLVLPEERHAKRLQNPQTEWDIVQGIIMAYREGDVPVARAYMEKYASGMEEKVIGVLKVWADGCGSDALRKEAQRILFGFK